MSLINDALKRATQTPSSSPTTPAPEPNTPMQHVEYRRAALPWYFFPMLLVVLAGACWFIVKGVQATRQASVPLQVHAREPQPAPTPDASSLALSGGAPMPDIAPAVDNSTPAAPIPNRNFSLDDEPAASAAPAPTPVATPPAETPKPAAYKLQGIFFRTANPSAMVNGKNVSVGSRVSGAMVKSITRDTVTLEADGQTTVLTLE
jgi:hypothetical protein